MYASSNHRTVPAMDGVSARGQPTTAAAPDGASSQRRSRGVSPSALLYPSSVGTFSTAASSSSAAAPVISFPATLSSRRSTSQMRGSGGAAAAGGVNNNNTNSNNSNTTGRQFATSSGVPSAAYSGPSARVSVGGGVAKGGSQPTVGAGEVVMTTTISGRISTNRRSPSPMFNNNNNNGNTVNSTRSPARGAPVVGGTTATASSSSSAALLQPQPHHHQHVVIQHGIQRQQHSNGGGYDINNNMMNQQPPQVYTVSNTPTAGSLFVAITKALVARGDWVQVGDPPAMKEIKATPAPGSQGAANPCCSKLRGINLFMGDKTVAEKLMAEARIVGMRARRTASSSSSVASSSTAAPRSGNIANGGNAHKGNNGMLLSCVHNHRVRGDLATPPDDNVVNFLEGSRCITMKSRMVRTLLAYYNRRPQLRPLRFLYEYLPITFILTPLNPNRRITPVAYVDERDAMIDTMKTVNDSDPNGVVSTWIAKCSNGCHGDGIKIVKATSGGLKELLSYIDGFKDGISWVVCRYIDRPLLYKGRKFDIRVWVLLKEDGRVFMHRDLVMRLSSVKYNPEQITTNTKEGLLANITNHCIQTTGDNYGKDEDGNELWWDSLSALLLETEHSTTTSGGSGGGGGKSAAAGSGGGGVNYGSMNNSPIKRPPNVSGRVTNTINNTNLPADAFCVLQMQRIIVESFSATKESIALEKSMVVAVPQKEMNSNNPSNGHIGGMPILPINSSSSASSSSSSTTIPIIPYPTVFLGGGFTASSVSSSTPEPLSSASTGTVPSPQPNLNKTKSAALNKVGCESFQMFGFDFLIDDSHRVWLLEINGSPGVADRLMEQIVADTIETAIDDHFPPLLQHQNQQGSSNSNGAQKGRRVNKYELIYGPNGVNKAVEYYQLVHGGSAAGKGFE